MEPLRRVYEEPRLEKREKLVDVTEATIGIGGVSDGVTPPG
jgi:hypothetical protein